MFTKDDIEKANDIDLYTYLLTNHKDDVRVCGEWLKFIPDPSVNIKAGNHKWKDYSGKKNINNREWLSNIDFMILNYGLSLDAAIEELLNYSSSDIPLNIFKNNNDFYLPPKDNERYTQSIAYLTKTRCIPQEVVLSLIKNHLLYQTTVYNPNTNKSYKNIVFINKNQDFYELHGTNSYLKSFHGCNKKQIDNYWYIKKGDRVDRVYVCEATIDAISLFVLHSYAGHSNNSMYVSIGGVNNYKTIERLITEYKNVVLAIDNDKTDENGNNAANTCREHFPNLINIYPEHKDWNEDLQYFLNK